MKDNSDIAINGVKSKPTKHRYWCHVNNLTVTHASIGAFVKTERYNHNEMHHQQLLESMHNITTYDKDVSHSILAEIMEGNYLPPMRLRTKHERVQKWFVNQRYAK